ncbi:MAG: 50S ribosomal protein L13 [Chloroflexi bacterium]|jgi:large subunit ribosomal protein L13|nr:50S ribosomal protein L13 [Chloroflexota bacterium]MCH2537626.1 50S ribosomal protein L13 [Dehalococcoidia bacterium]MEE2926342.1 50S ribosomal protein L13 [Chloroflexota bacterium]HIB11360.1 50S ribosomal protein L13 [Dehalococcoidia bacterium]HIM48552.1 50S ribosomal protein L13 [Dehalococcoidia bacterium]
MKRTSTYFPKPGEVPSNWRVIDATGQTLGRVARDISVALQGKDKTSYTAHVITGDFVVVLNAANIRVTGKKMEQKLYYRHSGYVGNLKTFKLADIMKNRPERVIELAVKGMLPKNHNGRQMLRRLKVYAGDTHPHQAQVAANANEAEE